MVKDLEELIEISRGILKSDKLNYLNCTYPIFRDVSDAIILDFKNITNPANLTVSGFDSVCATCDKHYSVVFVPTTGNTVEESGYRDIFLNFGVNDLNIITIQEFVELLFNSIKNATKFISHYTQYYYEDTKLYIYDYRDGLNTTLNYTNNIHFYTQVYKVPVDIYATYSESIPVGNIIDIGKLKVYIRYSTYEDEEISSEDCTITNNLITLINENTVIIEYQSKKYNLIVYGIPDIQSISAIYTGDKIKLSKEGYTELNKDLIQVTINTLTKGEFVLESKDFTIDPSVITKPTTEIEITYKTLYETVYTYITVQSELAIDRLMVWYEGDDVVAGNNYDPQYVRIYSIDTLGNYTLIDFQDSRIKLDSLSVLELGENWFTCSLIENGDKVQDIFCVIGITVDSIIDKKLQILYIKNKVRNLYLDITDKMLPYVELDGILSISLKNFLYGCNKLFFYDGIFRVTLPANTGFNCRFASQWIFIVKDGKTIKAKQIKIYRY